MPMRAVINYVGSPAAKAKQLRAIVKDANQLVVREWHREDLPEHFNDNARRRYSYQPRKGELSAGTGREQYHQRKLRVKGHGRPLVWSGQSQRMAMRSIRVSGSSKRARGVLNVPRYIYQYRKDQSQPDKADEMTRATRKEAIALARSHGRRVRSELQQIRTTQRKRVT